ncbi:MAG TPA: hypothetical protein VGI39_08025 [Polyangiaceae bacterium]
MSPRSLARILIGYVLGLALVCALVRHAFALREVDGAAIWSGWRGGELVGRVAEGGALPRAPGMTLTQEQVVAEGALWTVFEPVFAVSVVAGRDGVKATLGDRTAYVTPDDLLARQAYDHGLTLSSLSLSLGVDVPLVEALLAERLGTTVPELRAKATFRRFRTNRVVGYPPQPYGDTKPEQVTPELLRGAAIDLAKFLARGVGADGRFRYMIDAPTNRTIPGYDWPRHAGATYFLAQAAGITADPRIRDAALLTGAYLRDHATLDCGAFRCVGAGDMVDLGSSSLAVIAMSEIAMHLDPSFRAPVEELTRFIRAQERPDGEFMHQYDRRAKRPIDTQGLYYSGEATLALTRAFTLTGDPADLDGAKRGLAHLVGPAWSFFGDRYYFGEEHWTCQAMGDLWDSAGKARSANPDALDFCRRWRAYDAKMMYGPGESPFDADGAFGVGPVVTPRLTPVASRTEASVATLRAMIDANLDPAAREALTAQTRRSFALLIRQQLRPGESHLFADPGAVYGGMPGSPVDWQLRIDFAQHAGSAMIRAAELWSK